MAPDPVFAKTPEPFYDKCATNHPNGLAPGTSQGLTRPAPPAVANHSPAVESGRGAVV
jgi:hypothetical protein